MKRNLNQTNKRSTVTIGPGKMVKQKAVTETKSLQSVSPCPGVEITTRQMRVELRIGE
jgi:hypothetical protein